MEKMPAYYILILRLVVAILWYILNKNKYKLSAMMMNDESKKKEKEKWVRYALLFIWIFLVK